MSEIRQELQNCITIEHCLAVLNEAAQMDPEAMKKLVKARVTCNEAIAKHPTIQCGKFGDEFKVGFLGMLNGLFGISSDGWGPIAIEYDLACPDSMEHKPDDEQKFGEPCKVCGAKLGTGNVRGFTQVRKP